MERYQVAIIGGGPAGAGAAVYAARKQLKTVLITDEWGGQSVVSNEIFNWIGSKAISGADLGKNLEEHVRSFPEVTIQEERATAISDEGDFFRISLPSGDIEAERIVLTVGSRRRKLGIPGEEEFNGKGVVYCATCDAPVFGGQEVAVIGGGNAGLEAVVDLLGYATKIYLLDRSGVLKGDPATQEKVLASDKVVRVPKVETLEVLGDKFVSGLRYKETDSGEIKELAVTGVFVEIGSIPNGDIVKELVDLNERGQVVVDHKTQKTSHPRIWAAGDVTDGMYQQNNIAVGEAVVAVLNLYDEVKI